MSSHIIKEAIKYVTPETTHDSLRKMRESIKQPFKKSVYFLNYYYFYRQYKYPIIYIAACPKTASTWLSNLLVELLPGFALYHPKLHVEGQKQNNYNVTKGVVAELSKKLVIIRSHTPATPENIDMMDQQFGSYLSLTRDLRDVIVSIYYHIRKKPMSAFIDHGVKRTLPWKPISPKVIEFSKMDCMDVLIEQLLPDLVNLSKAWHDYSRKKQNICLIRYEDLILGTQNELKKILKFFEIRKPDLELKYVIEKMGQTSKKYKKHNFRKGKINGWRDELSVDQQKRCEQIAGLHLSDMGYRLYHESIS
jgi:Sulfotransferase domain